MILHNKFLSLIGLGLMLTLIACGESSSDDDDDSSDEGLENSASAIGALFSSGSSAQLKKVILPDKLLALFVKTAQAAAEGAGERNTCDDPDDDGMADGPQEITTPLSGTAGTYGDPSGTSLILTEDDFCQDADGTENTGSGPGELGLLASFTLSSEVEGTCTAADSTETTMTMESGSGAWRNTEDSFPEIYGTFIINGTEVDCTILMNEDQTVREGSCSNPTDGSAISMDTDVTCQFSAGDDEEHLAGEDGEDTSGTASRWWNHPIRGNELLVSFVTISYVGLF